MNTNKVGNTVTTNELDWGPACVAAAEENDKFLIFRSTKTFMRVIEGSPKEAGYWNLKRLLCSQLFKKTCPLLQLSDSVGFPGNKIPFSIGKDQYSLCPTTIRYANNALNAINFFGENIIRNGVIYEIGGGYGGEATVFNHFSQSLFETEIGERWCIYDLNSSHALIRRFMHCFGYKVTIKKDFEITGDIDLVISNGALSEMWGETLDTYIKNVVAPAKCGYFITNFDSHSAPYGGITTIQFVKILKNLGKEDVTILPASQYLSRFDEVAGTKLIIFGRGDLYKHKHVYDRSLISKLTFNFLRIADRLNQFVLMLYLK